MPTYLHPGVYVEEIPSGSKPIEGVGTSTAAFVGYTTKGPIGEPTLIQKWGDFDTQFGGIRDSGTNIGDPMGFSVSAFFQNGGGKAYIVRITKDWNTDDDPVAFDAEKAQGVLDHPDPSNTIDGLVFTAANEGEWGNNLVVQVVANEDFPGLYTVQVGSKNAEGDFFPDETFADVSLDKTKSNFIEHVINDASELVSIKVKPISAIVPTVPTSAIVGTCTSGEFTDLDNPDLNLGSAGTLKINIDGTGEASISIAAGDYTATSGSGLSALAAVIESAVQATADPAADPDTTIHLTGFTCAVNGDGNRLVLTSGTRSKTSSVVLGASALANKLLLNSGNKEEVSGQNSYDAWVQNWTDSFNVSGGDEVTLSGGNNGSKPDTDDYQDVFTRFLKYRDINIICLPGHAWGNVTSQSIIDAAIAHAEKMKSRMVIVDPPEGAELETPLSVSELGLPSKTYSVLYYPWVKVANPFYNAETNPGAQKTVLVPPSGFAAGMWAKIDGKRGVWKAPAGLESGLLGVAGLQHIVEDGEQDSLNPWGVNCLRKMPGAGPVIWGARTLATKADPEWRYVPVRRTAIMIEQSIYNGIQWAVFEPNDHRLWSALRANIGNFMNGLFRSGAFQGEKASDAYFVRCGLGDTMTQGDIDAGQVIVVVGFAPLKPAEFVIVRIQQKVNQQ